MPALTKLERALDVCVSIWRTPKGQLSPPIISVLSEKDHQAWLQGETPPRPDGIGEDWTYVSSELELMFTNGNQVIGNNEMGDKSCYAAEQFNGKVEYSKPPPQYRAVILENGDVPIVIDIPSQKVIKGDRETVSTTEELESIIPNKSGEIPKYRIVDGVATKTGTRS